MASRLIRSRNVLLVLIAILGMVGWSALQPRDEDIAWTHKPVSRPNVASLMMYAAPSADVVNASDEPTADTIAPVRDPFGYAQTSSHADERRAPAVKEPAAPHWSVSATMVTGSRSAAIIDDQLVYVGDALPGGGRLTAVERDCVTVTDAKGASHVLTVKEGE